MEIVETIRYNGQVYIISVEMWLAMEEMKGALARFLAGEDQPF